MSITLKAARANKGLTQKEAAKALGISEQTIINWEKGRSFPSVKQIKCIEELYGTSYNELIFLNENNALSVKNAMA